MPAKLTGSPSSYRKTAPHPAPHPPPPPPPTPQDDSTGFVQLTVKFPSRQRFAAFDKKGRLVAGGMEKEVAGEAAGRGRRGLCGCSVSCLVVMVVCGAVGGVSELGNAVGCLKWGDA